ncbi:MAG: BadF/BadG/BcrA/BcrD ATPase family protein, partial [Bacillota bacterium]|nr:BadF/BadG/BcrA/BcrD ATPase family protein [Bacillota bacterium]
MKYYLGIDGGGTKTKFTLANEKMEVINEYIGPACHYLQCGYDGLSAIMADGVFKVTNGAKAADGAKASDGSAITPADIAYAFAGIAGYGDVINDAPRIRAAVKDGMGEVPFGIGNDCENALAGALGNRPGINIIAGTGSVGCGINDKGDYERCGGWHHVLGGDEGSGYWIGWNLIKEFQRQSDGRDEKTALYNAVRNTLSLRTDDQIVTRVVEEWNLDRTKIASLAPVCQMLYEAGDPHAKAILTAAAEELAEFAIALYNRLGFSETNGNADSQANQS